VGISIIFQQPVRQAISDFDRAIEINPEYANAFKGRGVAYGKLGNLRQAISDFDRAIEIDPDYAMAYYNRGVIYGWLGHHSQAISDFDRAIEIDPDYAMAYYDRGVIYDWLGNRRQEIEDVQKAARSSSKLKRSNYYRKGFKYDTPPERSNILFQAPQDPGAGPCLPLPSAGWTWHPPVFAVPVGVRRRQE
jgi:tetratricopeptide (TPR) repeat protein